MKVERTAVYLLLLMLVMVMVPGYVWGQSDRKQSCGASCRLTRKRWSAQPRAGATGKERVSGNARQTVIPCWSS